jgi:hypothetical protein
MPSGPSSRRSKAAASQRTVWSASPSFAQFSASTVAVLRVGLATSPPIASLNSSFSLRSSAARPPSR